MSLSEQLGRVCGGEKNALKEILKKLGANDPGSAKIEEYAALAAALNIGASHTHSASQISGTLSAAHGGTGVSSLASLASALGMPKIATGSYTGTGTYGSANPCSLTFDFLPAFFVIQPKTVASRWSAMSSDEWPGYSLAAVRNSYYYSFGSKDVDLTWSGNNVRWYTKSATDADRQWNTKGCSYVYFAVG